MLSPAEQGPSESSDLLDAIQLPLDDVNKIVRIKLWLRYDSFDGISDQLSEFLNLDDLIADDVETFGAQVAKRTRSFRQPLGFFNRNRW